MHRTFILNPNSRNGKALRDFDERYESLGREIGGEFEVLRTEGPGHATELAKQVLQEGQTQQIIAAGGDGTINEVVNGYFFAGSEECGQIPLAILDLGTGGDLFRTLDQLSPDYWQAVKKNEFRLVDVAMASVASTTRRYLNIASAGLAGDMLRNLKASSFQSGPVAYFYHTIKTLIQYEPVPVVIETINPEGKPESLEVDLINFFVCNGRASGGGMLWAPDAELENGLLELTLISGREKMPLIKHSSKVYAGKIDEFPGATRLQAREVTIRSQSPVPLETDGEVIEYESGEGGSEIRFTIQERTFPLVM